MPIELIATIVRIRCGAPLHGHELPRDFLVPLGETARSQYAQMGYKPIQPYGLVCPQCMARIASDD